MFSYALSTGTHLATNYFHLPFDEEEDEAIEKYERKYLTWVSEPTTLPPADSSNTSPSTSRPASPSPSTRSLPSSSSSDSLCSTSETDQEQEESAEDAFINSLINESNLYTLLGVPNSPSLDKLTLRRAYLSRSRNCHPDKYPGNSKATEAFQRVAVAYDVLSTPASRRKYDASLYSSSPRTKYDVFAARPTNYAEETLKSVILGVFNDFLDGDLEVIRTLLTAVNDFNPGIRLGDDGINAILGALNSIRERARTCRVCVCTLHTELTRLLEAQHAFSQLSYFDLLGRTRLTIQLTRITVGIPLVLEKALLEKTAWEVAARGDSAGYTAFNHERNAGGRAASEPPGSPQKTILPRHALTLMRGIDVALERMERIIKRRSNPPPS